MTDVRCEVLMVVTIQVEVFWVVTPHNFAVGYQHFREPQCPHLQEADGGCKVLQILISYHYTI
jgi:hypothetical protein